MSADPLAPLSGGIEPIRGGHTMAGDGMGRVPISFEEERTAKVVTQQLRGGSALGLTSSELFQEAAKRGQDVDPGALTGPPGSDNGCLGQDVEPTAEDIQRFLNGPCLEGQLDAMLAAMDREDMQMGRRRRRRRRGFFKRIMRFAKQALPIVAGAAGIVTGGAIVGPAIGALTSMFSKKPKVRARSAQAVVAACAVERGGGCLSRPQRQQAALQEQAILRTRGGGRTLARARFGMFRRARRFGQGGRFARFSRPQRGGFFRQFLPQPFFGGGGGGGGRGFF